MRIFDPRASKCVAQCDSHQGLKDSCVTWINGSDRIFTTGFAEVWPHSGLISILTGQVTNRFPHGG